MKEKMITQEYLKEFYSYDQLTGIFIKKPHFDSRGRVWGGRQIGTKNLCGYIQIQIKKKIYLAHRLAWLYVYGEFPKLLLDHVNGIRDDNKISNLRECNHSQNLMNSPKRITNKSGYKGVWYNKANGRWRASVTVNRKTKHIGVFESAELAHMARVEAEKQISGEFFCER